MFMKFSDTLSFKIVLKHERQNNNFLDFWDYCGLAMHGRGLEAVPYSKR